MAFMQNKPLAGLRPVQTQGGVSPKITHYAVSATYATALPQGAPAIKAANGVRMAANPPVPVRGTVIGIIAADNPAYVSGSTSHQSTVAVYDDPRQVFVGTFNAAISAAQAVEYIGQFVGCVTNTANTTLGGSNLKLSTVTSVFSTTAWLQIVGVEQPVGGSLSATTWNGVTMYPQMQVKIGDRAHLWGSQLSATTGAWGVPT